MRDFLFCLIANKHLWLCVSCSKSFLTYGHNSKICKNEKKKKKKKKNISEMKVNKSLKGLPYD